MTQPPGEPQEPGKRPQRGLPPYGHDPQQPYPPEPQPGQRPGYQPGYPQGPNPYYPGPNAYGPPAQNQTNLVLGLILGSVLGTIIGAVLTFALFFETTDALNGWAVVLAIVVPFLLPIPLLFFPGTRPWGFGILMGVALGSLVLAGSCVWILDSWSVA